MKFLTFFLLVAVFSNNLSLAQEVQRKESPVHFLIAGALEFGGDDVAQLYFFDRSTQSVKAGQGGSIAVGAQFQLPKLEAFLLRATVGYKYVTTRANNANIRLTRIPINVTANWMLFDNLRLGAGIANHQNIKFKADGLGQDVNLKSSCGPTFEVAYHGIGLTYTLLSYKHRENLSYSANAIGISLSTTIGRRK